MIKFITLWTNEVFCAKILVLVWKFFGGSNMFDLGRMTKERLFNDMSDMLRNNMKLGGVFFREFYRKNNAIYKQAEAEVLKALGGFQCNLEVFPYIISSRALFDNMGEREFEMFNTIMPYIMKVHAKELGRVGKTPDFVEILTKLKLTQFKFVSEEITFNKDKKKGKRTDGRLERAMIEGPNNVYYLMADSLKLTCCFDKLDFANQYLIYVHEVFHLLDLNFESISGKMGMSYIENNETMFKYLYEGDTDRRTNLVMQEMSKDGRSVQGYEEYQKNSYKLVREKMDYIMENYPEASKGSYGNIDEFKAFVDTYNRSHRLTLQEEERRMQMILDRTLFEDLEKKLPLIIKQKGNSGEIMFLIERIEQLQKDVEKGKGLNAVLIDNIFADLDRMGIEY